MGHWMCSALCGDDLNAVTPWWPTEQRFDIAPTERFLTDCCRRRLRAIDTVCRCRFQTIPQGDYGDYQDHRPVGGHGPAKTTWFAFASYYAPSWRIECNPDGGCKRFPIYKRGMHLREPQ